MMNGRRGVARPMKTNKKIKKNKNKKMHEYSLNDSFYCGGL